MVETRESIRIFVRLILHVGCRDGDAPRFVFVYVRACVRANGPRQTPAASEQPVYRDSTLHCTTVQYTRLGFLVADPAKKKVTNLADRPGLSACSPTRRRGKGVIGEGRERKEEAERGTRHGTAPQSRACTCLNVHTLDYSTTTHWCTVCTYGSLHVACNANFPTAVLV